MIHVTIDLDDLSGSWRIIRIMLSRDGAVHQVKVGDDVSSPQTETVQKENFLAQ